MQTNAISISFIGIDERSKVAYQTFFESIKSVKYKLVDDYKLAQLCLIDKDAYNIQEEYEKIVQNHPDKYILSLSIVKQPCTHEKEFYLQKPIKRETLQKILGTIFDFISGKTSIRSNVPTSAQIKKTVDKISLKYINNSRSDSQRTIEQTTNEIIEKEDSNNGTVVPISKAPKISTSNIGKLLRIKHEEYFVGDRPDIDINDAKQLKEIFYAPGNSFQSITSQACEKSKSSGHIVQLNLLNHVFYFDAQAQKVHCDVGPAIIRPLCLAMHDEKASYTVKPESFRHNLNYILQTNKNISSKKALSKHSWSMDAFLWVITLWCSRGRLPHGTDITQPVFLQHWPNLTRLEQIPHAVRIAALIYHHPITLSETAKQLGIAQRYVFSFYSACRSIGLSDVSMRNVDKIFASEKPEHNKNKSITSKLLSKLMTITDSSSISNANIRAHK